MLGLRVDSTYYDYLDSLGNFIFRSAEVLRMLSLDPDRIDMYIAQADLILNEAQEASSELIAHVEAAFITPLDKEDLVHITHNTLNIIDSLSELAKSIGVLKVGKISREFKKAAEILIDLGGFAKEAISCLRSKSRRMELIGVLRQFRRLKSDLTAICWGGLSKILSEKDSDSKQKLKWPTIYYKIEIALLHIIHLSEHLEVLRIKYA